MVIVALLKNPAFDRVVEMLPLEEWKRIFTIEELYHATLEPYDIILLDYGYILSKEMQGLGDFIHAFMNPKVFGVQYLPNQNVSFLYLNPIERISAEDFIKRRPWENAEQAYRTHHRFSCPVPCEVTPVPNPSSGPGHKTFLDQLSLNGCLIHGHYDHGSQISLMIPVMDEPIVLQGLIKWTAPWGKLGVIPQSGVLFQLESSETELLKNLLKNKIIPYYLSKIQFQNP
jgi:hypothetical protein